MGNFTVESETSKRRLEIFVKELVSNLGSEVYQVYDARRSGVTGKGSKSGVKSHRSGVKDQESVVKAHDQGSLVRVQGQRTRDELNKLIAFVQIL